MKVLTVIPYLGENYGGTSTAVKKIVQSLGKFNTEIDLVTTDANDDTHLDVPLQQWQKDNSTRTQYFPSWNRSDFILSPSLIQWLIRNISEYDIVHTHTIFAPLINFTHGLCQFHKIPYIMTPHGMLDPWAVSHKAWKKRLYYAQLEKPAIEKAFAIQSLNATEAKHIDKLNLSQSITIPNGININRTSYQDDPQLIRDAFPKLANKRLILFLARIDPKKGLDLLAPAFGKINDLFPETHLVIAGPNNIGYQATAEQFFIQENCQESVTFTGLLSGKLKQSALNAAEIFVSPSYSEGFSLSILEAMAHALPCVITEGCNFPEAMAADVATVVPNQSNCIAEAIIQYLQAPQQAYMKGLRAKAFVESNYTWDKSALKLKHLYEQMFNLKKPKDRELARI